MGAGTKPRGARLQRACFPWHVTNVPHENARGARLQRACFPWHVTNVPHSDPKPLDSTIALRYLVGTWHHPPGGRATGTALAM
jgi:hypothetical protein